jgi:hypothetical protein
MVGLGLSCGLNGFMSPKGKLGASQLDTLGWMTFISSTSQPQFLKSRAWLLSS